MINVVEKFREIVNKAKQATRDDKYLDLVVIGIKLKRFIALVKLNWPQGKRYKLNLAKRCFWLNA